MKEQLYVISVRSDNVYEIVSESDLSTKQVSLVFPERYSFPQEYALDLLGRIEKWCKKKSARKFVWFSHPLPEDLERQMTGDELSEVFDLLWNGIAIERASRERKKEKKCFMARYRERQDLKRPR